MQTGWVWFRIHFILLAAPVGPRLLELRQNVGADCMWLALGPGGEQLPTSSEQLTCARWRVINEAAGPGWAAPTSVIYRRPRRKAVPGAGLAANRRLTAWSHVRYCHYKSRPGQQKGRGRCTPPPTLPSYITPIQPCGPGPLKSTGA